MPAKGPRGPGVEGALSVPRAHSPLYDQYCKDHFRDGHCDQGCNSAECEWDGLDCAEHVPERLAAGTLVLVVLMPPEQLRNHSLHFLRELSRLLHTNVVFKRDASGQQMIGFHLRSKSRICYLDKLPIWRKHQRFILPYFNNSKML